MSTRTTILGTEYEGRPMMGTLACSLYLLERDGKADEARALLDAHNHIRKCFGSPPVDLADQFTTAPMEGLLTFPAVRDIDRVVEQTARRVA